MGDILKRFVNRPWFVLLSIIVMYRPEYFIQIEEMDITINILRVCLVLFIGFTYFVSSAPSKSIIWCTILFGGYNIWCTITRTWNFNVLIEFALILCVNMLIEIWSISRLKILNNTLHFVLLIYGVLNIITILMNLEVEYLFLGFDNDISMRVIPLIGVMLYTSMLVKGKFTYFDYAIFVLYICNFLLTWAATSLVSIIVMGGYIFWEKIKLRFVNSKTIIVGSIFIWVALYVFKIQTYISFVFEKILNKDVTLSYRMYIWESVVAAIKQSPLMGYGNIMQSDIYYDITYKMYYASIAPHNFWLYIVASMGVLGCVVFIAYICWCFKHVDLNPIKIENKILIGTLMSYMLCGVFSSYYGLEYFALLLAIANQTRRIDSCIS